jgi:hypothetical protein
MGVTHDIFPIDHRPCHELCGMPRGTGLLVAQAQGLPGRGHKSNDPSLLHA